MSGKDEKPKPVIETDERVACPECGETEWEQFHSYSNVSRIDLESGFTDEGDIEWCDASEWQCTNCGGEAPRYIAVKLGRLY